MLGEVTARMHVHARQWQRPSWFTRHTWDFETSLGDENPHWGRWRDGMGVDAAKAKLFGRTVDLIGAGSLPSARAPTASASSTATSGSPIC